MGVDLHIPLACARLQQLAERDPRRCVGLAARALAQQAEPSELQTWARYTHGWALLCWERIDAARTQLWAAEHEFVAQSHNFGSLCCRYALLLADQLQLAQPQLEHEFTEITQAFLAVGAPQLALRSMIEHARHLNVLGRPRDAEALLDQCDHLLEHARPIDRARLDRMRGNAANARNDFVRAGSLLERAAQAFAALHYPIDAAKCQLDCGWLALRQEQLDRAAASYAQATHAAIRHDLPLQQAFCAKNQSLLLAKRGAYRQAVATSLTALAHFIALRRTSDIAASHLHLGNIHYYIGRWEAAACCYQQAEPIYAALGMQGYRLLAQRNRAMVYRIQGRLAEATALFEQVEAGAHALENLVELAEVRSNQAALMATAGAWEPAARGYREARAIFAQHQNLHAVAECDLELGWIALMRNDALAAQAAFQAAIPATQQHPHDRWRVLYGLARCAEHAGQYTAALAHYRAASEIVGCLRRQLASAATSSALFAQAADMYRDALRLALGARLWSDALTLYEAQRALVLQRALQHEPAADLASQQRELQALRARLLPLIGTPADVALLDALLVEYAPTLPTLALEHAPAERLPLEPIDLAQLRAQLGASYGRDWSALIYLLLGDTLWIGLLTATELAFVATPYDAALCQLVEQATHQAYRNYTYRDYAYLQGATNQPWQRLRALADRLLPTAVRNRLHPTHRLLIVPADALHALPWAALRLADAWLVERAQIQLLPSLAVWSALERQAPAAQGGALFIGCATFRGRAAVLPGIAAEQAMLARHWARAASLRDEQASRSTLLELAQRGELRQYRLIHIASHAQLTPTRGHLAHLKLADADLSLEDLSRLNLAGCLVVLSACDGAAAEVLPGEEVYSLSWALLAAGARAVLASLWPLNDQSAVELLEQFYAELPRASDATLALAQAQRASLRASASPAEWGCFVLIGVGMQHG